MRPPTRAETARAFDEIAAQFDRTRERPWPEIMDFGRSLPPRSLVLDLGCGNGRHAAVLAEEGHRVVGLDASAKLLGIARHRVAGVTFARADLCCVPFLGGRFAAAIAIAAIHHLPSETERLAAVREIARVLRPGGRALVTAWAAEQPRFERVVETRRARGEPAGDVWVPWRMGGREVPRFYHLFVDNELPQLVLRSGLRVERYFRTGDNYAVVAERHG